LRQLVPWYAGGLGRSLISWGGLAVCRVRELVGRGHEDYSRITIFQSGGLGDAVLTLPIIDGLRRRWPRARLAVVADGIGQEFFTTFTSGISVYVPGTAHGGGPPGAELLLHLRGGLEAVRAAWQHPTYRFLSGLPRRSRLRWTPLYYLGLPAPCSREHQYETFCRALRPLGLELPDGPSLRVRQRWQESLTAKLRGKDLADKRLAVVHPFGKWAPRAWPWDRWLEICAHLYHHLNLEICLVGGSEDLNILRRRASTPTPLRIFVGELSLGELAALCARAEVFLGNDSGPAHLAAAAGARCVVLYGPQEAALFGVRSSRAVAVQGRAFCTPCWQTVCPFDQAPCLDSISVEAVQAALHTALALPG
jgi:ADP-heptose:LPS heptosyltransferase